MYSLALLNSDYSGNCVTVRRASDNATQDIGFDGQDLDIAALESFCSGTDGFVSVWFDQSGNGKNATQTTASSQPKIVSSGSVILENGKPAISFDGVNDFLQNTTANLLVSDDSLIVSVFNAATDVDFNIFDSAELAAKFFLQYDSVIGYVFENNLASFNLNFSTIQSQLLATLQFDGTTLDSYFDSSNTSTHTVSSQSATGLIIGSNRVAASKFLNGTMQSFIIWNINQSGNRIGIETALNDYYSIY